MVRFYYSSSADCRNAFALCVYISRVLPAIKKIKDTHDKSVQKKQTKKLVYIVNRKPTVRLKANFNFHQEHCLTIPMTDSQRFPLLHQLIGINKVLTTSLQCSLIPNLRMQ